MRLTIDMEGALTDGSCRRGIGRFTTELAEAMASARGGHVLNLAMNARHAETAGHLARHFVPHVGRGAISRYRSPVHRWPDETPAAPTRQIAEEIQRRHLAQTRPDAILFTSLLEFARDDVTPVDLGRYPGRLNAAILYDLIPLRFPELYLRDPVVEAAYLEGLKTLRSADLLLTISEASRQDAISLLGVDPDRIVDVSAAAARRFRPLALSEEARAACTRHLGLSRPFVTYVSGSDARKNLRGALDIFAALPASIRKAHQLLLVTNLPPSKSLAMQRTARALGLEPDGLVIMDGVDDDGLVRLLNTARALVFPSLYEGFGLPVLEAMQCGTPVLAAGHSSLTEIVQRGDAMFANGDLVDAAGKLARILTDEAHRAELSAWGIRQAQGFSWDRTAELAWQALETGLGQFESRNPRIVQQRLLELDGARHDLAAAIAVDPRHAPDPAAIVDDLLFSVPRFHDGAQRRLLVDVGVTVKSDIKTGIQRVVRRLCAALQQRCDPHDLVVLPISLKNGHPVALPGFSSADRTGPGSYPIDIRAGDDLFMLDSNWAAYPHLGPVFDRITIQGGRIITCIYDLVPELHPDVCADGMVVVHRRWLAEAVARSHVLLCISKAVADELEAYIEANDLPRRGNQRIDWFHCGADVGACSVGRLPSREISEIFDTDLPVAVMVGTIEPRKRQDVALAAFERLWAEGHQMSLCLIGKAGWNVAALTELLRDHPETGRRLHWLEGASDADLTHAYDHAEVALCCSLAEGFGLPIAEAGRRGCRVICSDIPVFREVGGSAVSYYPVDDAGALADLLRSGRYRQSAWWAVKPLTWRQSAARVLELLYDSPPSAPVCQEPSVMAAE